MNLGSSGYQHFKADGDRAVLYSYRSLRRILTSQPSNSRRMQQIYRHTAPLVMNSDIAPLVVLLKSGGERGGGGEGKCAPGVTSIGSSAGDYGTMSI